MPGAFATEKEIRGPDRNNPARLPFLDDEGTGNGGSIFGGRKVDGKIESAGHLSFDQQQDPVVAAAPWRTARRFLVRIAIQRYSG